MAGKSPWTEEEREMIVAEVCGALCRGTPMAEVCRGKGMPDVDTILIWAQNAPDTIGRSIARARTAGYDRLATEALEILEGKHPIDDKPADVQRDKARAEIRLKLLAKWDPKRYGDAFQLRHADADGEKLDTAPLISEMVALVRGVRERLQPPDDKPLLEE